ncbi:MATE family efflux transporter [Mameliella alba]|nr:MATE family efflux transporter [Antarctobacter heliothermus]MBY6146586.1 MATE family efflux transporter [Mameliella alba]MBY6162815.1 MATE family efflux transporter [Mameliella alba]MBY6171078.1 MATE family efflux transporter [Mameliella alba]MBY6176302.1 MATE family efflux transporter [Mameliella alba]
MSIQVSYSEHRRAVLRLGLPLIGGHLAQFAIGLTDTIMIGWYGVPELAALTIAGSFFFTVFLFGSGFAWAIMPMVARYAAQEDEVLVRRATRMALWLSILYFILTLPLFWFSGPILRGMGQTEEVAGLAQTYLRLAGIGLLPALGVMVLKNYLAGLEHTRVVLWITLVAALGNVLANYTLIFGNWGAPELGISGAALASVSVQVVSLVLVAIYALRILPEHALFVRFWRPDWEMFAQVFHLGWPIGLTTLAEVALFAASAVLMGWLGTIPLAAHGVALQIASAAFMIQLGLSNAATVRAGNALGRGDSEHLLRGARVVTVLGAITSGLTVVLFVAIPETLLGLFIDPAEPQRDAILAAGKGLLAMAALFQIVDAAQVIHIGLLRGLQDTRVPMLMAALAYWGIGMPSAWVFGFALGWGGEGIWFGLVVGLAAAAALLMHRFWTQSRAIMMRQTAVA